jgi:hypothetical protein
VFLCGASINLRNLKHECAQKCFIKTAMVQFALWLLPVFFLEQCSLCKKKEEIDFYVAFSNIIERMRHFKKW